MSTTEQTEQAQPQISNEGAFCHALGLNPDTVVAGSVEVKFLQGHPFVQFTQIIQTNLVTLGAAMLAAGQPEETGDKQGPRQPQDRKKKRPAKKAAAPQEEEAGESAD